MPPNADCTSSFVYVQSKMTPWLDSVYLAANCQLLPSSQSAENSTKQKTIIIRRSLAILGISPFSNCSTVIVIAGVLPSADLRKNETPQEIPKPKTFLKTCCLSCYLSSPSWFLVFVLTKEKVLNDCVFLHLPAREWTHGGGGAAATLKRGKFDKFSTAVCRSVYVHKILFDIVWSTPPLLKEKKWF